MAEAPNVSKKRTKNGRQRSAPSKGVQSAKVTNNVGRFSGIGSEFDYGQYQEPATVRLSPFQQDKFVVDLYFSDWASKKGIQIPVDDQLRDGWKYEGLTDEQSALMVTFGDTLGVLEKFKQAMRLERLIGGCVIFMGIADGAEGPDKPVNYEALQKGCLKFMNVIPRTRVTNTVLDYDPLSPTYGEPLTYWVNGVQVHRDRLILFKGDPLLQTPDSSIVPSQWIRNDGFGVSVLMSMLDDLTRATGSRQAAYQLVQRASVFLFQADTMDLQATKQGQEAFRKMQDIVNQINLFRGAVVDRQPGDSDPITTISPSFGSVPELVMTFMQVLAAAFDIPGSRFFSQAPGSLNASDGGTSLENYYGGLEAKRKQELRPRLMKWLKVAGPSVLGDQYSGVKIDVVFEPLWSLSELEQSQVRTADVANVIALQTAQLLSDAEALDELKQRDALKVEIKPELIEDADESTKTPEELEAELNANIAALGAP
jgi:phage-related protein (TIGR01555 family)